MNVKALALAVPPGLVGIDGQHRHVAHQLKALAQHVFQADVVGLVIIAEKREDAPLHGVHQVPGRRLHDDVPERVGGQCPVRGQLHTKIPQLVFRGQFTEEQQIRRFLKGEASPALRAGDDVPAVDAAVVEHTVGGNDVLSLGDVVRLDLRHPGQARQNAPAILVPESPLDVVLFVQLGVDVVFLLPLLFERQQFGGDLAVRVLAVFLPDHGGVLLSGRWGWILSFCNSSI